MKNIAVISAGITVDHASRITKGIRDCTAEHNGNTFIFTCSRKYEKNVEHDVGEYNIYNLPDFEDFDGIVLINSTVGSETMLRGLAKRIEDSHTPAVSIEREDANMFNVYIDNYKAMCEIIEHMIEHHGYTRLNYISGPLDNAEAKQRLQAYIDVLTAHHIPVEEERIYREGTFLAESGELAVEKFLASDLPRPQAIISANDVMAIGACALLMKKGIRVPEDIAITGFDDDYAAAYHVPSITSIARQQEKVGYAACLKLMDGMTDADRGGELKIDTKMKLRMSCGCKSDSDVDNVTFRKRHFLEKEKEEKYREISNSMSVDLTSVENFTQLKQCIKQYIPKIKCEELYLFIIDDFSDTENKFNLYKEEHGEQTYLREGFGNEIQLLVGYDNGMYIENMELDFHGFMEHLKDSNKEKKVYTVSPVHFRDRCFGFCILGNCSFPFDTPIFYTWLMNIGNVIEMIRKQSLMRTMIEKLDSVWCYDTLTGVYNRSGFRKYGGKVWEDTLQRKQNVLIIFMDLDGLKIVNDTYGHEEGDNLIKSFADILIDIKRHGEAVMRYGGDEFVIISPYATDPEAVSYVKRIEFAMKKYNEQHELKYKLDASIGYHILYPENGVDIETAIEIADQKMYENKKLKKQRNRVTMGHV
ncbi:MAG: GGDEF domain-containing protein [bacterium]|nr:GGDEF domain-containing protein [bacterium]